MFGLPESEPGRVGASGRRDLNAEETRLGVAQEVNLFEEVPKDAAVVRVLQQYGVLAWPIARRRLAAILEGELEERRHGYVEVL